MLDTKHEHLMSLLGNL